MSVANIFLTLEKFVALQPRHGSMLGGTLIQLVGNNIKFDERAVYTCLFDDIEVEAMYLEQSSTQQILCVSPQLKRTGRVKFAISYINPSISTQKSILVNDTFFSCKYSNHTYMIVIN